MGKITYFEKQLIIQLNQTKDIKFQGIVYVNEIKGKNIYLSELEPGARYSGHLNLDNFEEFSSENWMTLKEFFKRAKIVDKELIFEEPALPGKCFCIRELKDIQFILQIDNGEMNTNFISKNIYKNHKGSTTLTQYCNKTFKPKYSQSQIDASIEDLFSGKNFIKAVEETLDIKSDSIDTELGE